MADLDDKLFILEEHYQYLESSFVDVVKLIPLENNPDTFSPRLYEILQSTCSQVDSIVKLLHTECLGKSANWAAAKQYSELDRTGVFSIQEIAFLSRPDWKPIKPFSCDFACAIRDTDNDLHGGKGTWGITPKWWQKYNTTKHALPDGYKEGSIENTYLALAGLYVLHVMICMLSRNEKEFLNQNFWRTGKLIVLKQRRKRIMNNRISGLQSAIFIPLTEFLFKKS